MHHSLRNPAFADTDAGAPTAMAVVDTVPAGLSRWTFAGERSKRKEEVLSCCKSAHTLYLASHTMAAQLGGIVCGMCVCVCVCVTDVPDVKRGVSEMQTWKPDGAVA